MSESVEKVYADALFSLCKENGDAAVKEAYESLQAVGAGISANPDFIPVLESPVVSKEEKLGLCAGIFKNRLSAYAYNTLCVLVENGRAEYLPAVIRSFGELYGEYFNLLDVTVYSAKPLGEGIKSRLLSRLTEVTGKTVTLTTVIKPELLGGAVIEYGNVKLDGSVKTKLESIKSSIAKSII